MDTKSSNEQALSQSDFEDRLKKQEFEDERDRVLETLKSDINDFLFTRMSPKTTLKEADELAVHVYRVVSETWRTSR